MIRASQLNRITPRLLHWSAYHEQWKVSFDSTALLTLGGVVLIDPMQPEPSVMRELRAFGNPSAILLTNANHGRDADWFRQQLAIPVHAHRQANGLCDCRLDCLFDVKSTLPGGLTALALPGSAAGSVVYYANLDGGIAFVGDAILHDPVNGIEALPDQYCEDAALARQSLPDLLSLDFNIAVFAHGAPLVTGAKKQVASFIQNRLK